MKKILFILLVIAVASCKQQDSITSNSNSNDDIKNSPAYQEYVIAFNDYQSCKEERPNITTAYMNKELTAPEFEKALEKNAKICALKKKIFTTRWELIQAQYDEIPEGYEIKAD